MPVEGQCGLLIIEILFFVPKFSQSPTFASRLSIVKDEIDDLAEKFCKRLEPIFERNRQLTFAAKLLGKGDEVLASGEARLGTESEPGFVWHRASLSLSMIEFVEPHCQLLPIKRAFRCFSVHLHSRAENTTTDR